VLREVNASLPDEFCGIGLVEIFDRVTMQVFVRERPCLPSSSMGHYAVYLWPAAVQHLWVTRFFPNWSYRDTHVTFVQSQQV